MKPTPHRKCQHCRRAYTPDYRNRKRQKYCQQPDCRKAAKAACQRAWLTKPENQDYFRGPDNTRSSRRRTSSGMLNPSCKGVLSAASALARSCVISSSSNFSCSQAWPWLIALCLLALARIFVPSTETVMSPTLKSSHAQRIQELDGKPSRSTLCSRA